MFPITRRNMSAGISAISWRILSFSSSVLRGGGFLKTTLFKYPHKKKSHAVKSGDLAGHAMSPYLETMCVGNKRLTASMEHLAVWADSTGSFRWIL
ncbi:hypothetical protein C0J52_18665 [Blattella germanica]|nr:hypothetical protein C0J52_18665 [Blattella germanica]